MSLFIDISYQKIPWNNKKKFIDSKFKKENNEIIKTNLETFVHKEIFTNIIYLLYCVLAMYRKPKQMKINSLPILFWFVLENTWHTDPITSCFLEFYLIFLEEKWRSALSIVLLIFTLIWIYFACHKSIKRINECGYSVKKVTTIMRH